MFFPLKKKLKEKMNKPSVS